MAVTLKFYADAGLTTEITPKLTREANIDGSSGAISGVFYLGSAVASKVFKAASNPGVAPISLSIIDGSAGSGQEASAFKLALSSGGLDVAVAGASLALGTQILSGAGNAIAIYWRWTNAVTAVAVDSSLSLRLTQVNEYSV